MKFIFSYEIKDELERVQDTINKKKFFNKNGYYPLLPETITFDDFDIEKAKKQIIEEFNQNEANKVKERIIANWDKYGDKIEDFLKILPYRKPDELKIKLTKYGLFRSYYLPNTIILNIKNLNDPLLTIVNQLIHLIIEEPIIEKHQLNQSEKESLVDYILNESKALNSIWPWMAYQDDIPSKELLKKVGWDKLLFERSEPKKENRLITKYNKEVAEFFNVDEVKVNVYLINSRGEFDEIYGGKTKGWMVGFTRNNTVFIMNKEKFETDSCHPKSDFEQVLKHEVSHIYYQKINKRVSPVWLNEGLACFIAKQNTNELKEQITMKTLEQFNNKGGAKVYPIGRYMVDQIINHYGKEKLFELIAMNSKNERDAELKKMFTWL